MEALDATTFEVAVEGDSITRHRVTVSPEYQKELTAGKISTDELIKRSFEFLLEREASTSILRSFDLPLIGRYFPEYEETIRDLTSL